MDGYFQHHETESGGSFKAFWRVLLVIDKSTLVPWDGATRYHMVSKYPQAGAAKSSPPAETLPGGAEPSLSGALTCWGPSLQRSLTPGMTSNTWPALPPPGVLGSNPAWGPGEGCI